MDINSLSEKDFKKLENRLRRQARQQGLHIVKSRTRNERALNYGSYLVVDTDTNCAVLGGNGYADLDDVKTFLSAA